MIEPPLGTIERWAWDLIFAPSLETKLAPAPPPSTWELDAPVRRIAEPARPPELRQAGRRQKTPRPGALLRPERRAELLHRFFHHELQAAELLAWAVLAFPSAPRSFRRGLLTIARDELRHVALYRERLIELGHPPGSFPINDWFWSRVPSAESPVEFLATLGIGLEGANLDHARRFAEQLRAAGDEASALLQERIAAEEIPHVSFAMRWFARLTDRDATDFDTWRSHLIRPLSPKMMIGRPLNRTDRRAAGFDPPFLDELARWDSPSLGS